LVVKIINKKLEQTEEPIKNGHRQH